MVSKKASWESSSKNVNWEISPRVAYQENSKCTHAGECEEESGLTMTLPLLWRLFFFISTGIFFPTSQRLCWRDGITILFSLWGLPQTSSWHNQRHSHIFMLITTRRTLALIIQGVFVLNKITSCRQCTLTRP